MTNRVVPSTVSLFFLLIGTMLLATGGAPSAQSRGVILPPQAPSELLTQAQTNGSVRVIARLNLPVMPEGGLPAAVVTKQRALIAAAGDAVIAHLGVRAARLARRYRYVPYVATEASAADLQALAASPEVAEILEDQPIPLALAESAPLIGAPAAWAEGFTGAGWTVAIVDTGVDKTHPFFGGRIVSEACYSSTFSSGSTTSTSLCPGGAPSSTATGSGMPCAISGCEHGTHVAGIAAGFSSASFSGIAPGASIIAVQVFSSVNGTPEAWDSDILSGLEQVYALRTAFQIAAVNLSLGGGQSTGPCDSDPLAGIVGTLRSAGIATVVAAGNSGFTNALSSPACISSAISVGSTTDGSGGTVADQVSTFSNSSSLLTLWAPGQWITSSVPGGGFATFAGTSMAAPHVTGAWAVLKQRNPAATVDTIENALIATGVAITDPRNGVAKPRLNLATAVQALTPPCTYSVTPTTVSIGKAGGSVTVAVSTGAACPWAASSATSFASVNCVSGCAGSGSATVTVLFNSGVTQRTGFVTVAGTTITIVQAGASLGDLNGDGRADLIWQNTSTGAIATWYLNGFDVIATLNISQVTDLAWHIVGSGDLNGDGYADLVWQHDGDGGVAVWFMRGTQILSTQFLSIPAVADTNWRIRGVADANGDGMADLIWEHQTLGSLAIWFMNGAQVIGTQMLSIPQIDPVWQIVGAGDTDGDGKPEIIWQHQTQGWLAAWSLNGAQAFNTRYLSINQMPDRTWKIRGVGDVDGDGRADLIWQNTTTGGLGVWLLNGATVTLQRNLSIPQVSDVHWQVVGPG